jgi:two-component sensor histidine kinase
VLEVDSRSEGEFSDHDIAFLQGAANILGMAIERQRRERDLAAALEHQKVLVKEINHRVKNSLQLVASMLNMQAGSGSERSQQLQDASRRVMAIGRAHDRLYRSPQIEKIDLQGYLADMCIDLKDVTPNCEIHFQASEPVFLNTDRAISLALVVTELVANAAKHAYPLDTGGPVWVHLTRDDDGVIRVSVRDEGVGLRPDFDLNKTGGLGMRLAGALTKQAGAKFEAVRGPHGSEFVVEIPSIAANTASA